ncbi:MAG TPA: phage holin [Scandinavium sp.]|jgi:hypothetical protein
MKFTNLVYNTLKSLAQIYFPAAGTLYFALAGLWNFPDAQAVVGTIVAVDAFLGVVLSISSLGYVPPADGKLLIDTRDPAKNIYRLDLTTHPQEVVDSGRKSVSLNIEPAELSSQGSPR